MGKKIFNIRMSDESRKKLEEIAASSHRNLSNTVEHLIAKEWDAQQKEKEIELRSHRSTSSS